MIRRIKVDPVDTVAALAVASIVAGVGLRYGWDLALIVLGIIVLTVIVLITRSTPTPEEG